MNHKKPVVVELENLFSQLNEGFFGGELPIPTHVVHPEKKVVFKFTSNSYTIWIGSKFSDSKQDIVLFYLHEMIHIWNMKHRTVDCTSNQYHNKRFLEKALECGLYVARHKTQGWSRVSWDSIKAKKIDLCVPKQAAIDKRKQIVSAIKVNNDIIGDAQDTLRGLLFCNKPKQCFLKYACKCPAPHNSIRSGRRPDGPNALSIKCEKCGEVFTKTD